MRFFKQLTLCKQIRILFAFTILLTLGVGLLFYQVSCNSLIDKEKQYMYYTLAQIAQKTEDITTSVSRITDTVADSAAANNLLRNTNSSNAWDYRQSLNNFISNMTRSTPSISNILLLNTIGEVYGYSGMEYSLVNRLNAKYHLFSPGNYPDGFTGLLYDDQDDTYYFANIRTVFDNRSDSALQVKLGTCLVIVNCESLHLACSNTATTENARFLILDSDDQVLAWNGQRDEKVESAIIQSVQSNGETIYSDRIAGEKFLISQYPMLTLSGYQAISATPYTEITAGLTNVRILGILFLLLTLGEFLLLDRRIIRNITAPIDQIFQFMQRGPYFTLHHRISLENPHKINVNNEMGSLIVQINTMLDQLENLTTTTFQNQARLYELTLVNDRVKLSALQSQINPHFLYNTLNSIQGLAYLGKTEEICTTVSALSAIMHYSIKGEDMVEVQSELKYIQKYLQIIEIRFSGRFSFEFDIAPEILHSKMPRFLLQPMIENAVSHGLEPKPGKGSLILTGKLLEPNILHFECRDNGVGMSPKIKQKLEDALKNLSNTVDLYQVPEKQGIGLLNIHLRLQLIYGAPYGLTVSSTPGEGTVISIDFPATFTTDSSFYCPKRDL